MSAEFEWPWQHGFPPFYTIQPNLDTRKKQVEAWCSLVLAYHRHHRLYRLDVTEAHASPLFHNQKIDRKLSLDSIYLVLDELRKKGNVEFTDKSRRQCLVMWRSPDEWASLIDEYVRARGLVNTVCTLYELTEGEETAEQDFHGLESWLLERALKALQARGRAELMGTDGVKFFA